MNAKVKVQFCLSDEYRKARLIEAGEMIGQKQIAEYDLAEATPNERAAIIGWTGVDLHEIKIVTWQSGADWQDHKPINSDLMLDDVPSMSDIAAHCLRMSAEYNNAQSVYDASLLRKINSDMDEKMANMRKCIASRTRGSVDLSSYLKEARARLYVKTDEYDILRAEYDAMVVELESEIERAREKKEKEKARHEAEKLAWVEAHGSSYLKRACAAGHDCSRRYWIERAALEYPGYIVDVERCGRWKSRSCPSEKALDERDALLASHKNIIAEIVWLTDAPRDKYTEDDDDDEYFEECEALIVHDPAYAYDLMRII